MTSMFTLRTAFAALALALVAGCAGVKEPAAATQGSPSASAAAAPASTPDNAGWRRIHAGAGRT